MNFLQSIGYFVFGVVGAISIGNRWFLNTYVLIFIRYSVRNMSNIPALSVTASGDLTSSSSLESVLKEGFGWGISMGIGKSQSRNSPWFRSLINACHLSLEKVWESSNATCWPGKDAFSKVGSRKAFLLLSLTYKCALSTFDLWIAWADIQEDFASMQLLMQNFELEIAPRQSELSVESSKKNSKDLLSACHASIINHWVHHHRFSKRF